MADPKKLIIDAALEIEGGEDTTQLEVRGHDSQTQPLQRWTDDAGEAVAEVGPDGRLALGDVNQSPPGALVEANIEIEALPSEKPQRGWVSLGKISGVISDAITWMANELHLADEAQTGGVSGVHAALRSILRMENSGAASTAELRAGDFEAINEAGPVGQMTGVRGAVTNEYDHSLTKAVGVEATVANDTSGAVVEAAAFEVAPPVNNGTITTLYGLRIPDLDQGAANFAIHTGEGPVHLGDYLEVEILGAAPGGASGVMQLYAKSDGLYYVDDLGGETGPLGTGGGPADFFDNAVVDSQGSTVVNSGGAPIWSNAV